MLSLHHRDDRVEAASQSHVVHALPRVRVRRHDLVVLLHVVVVLQLPLLWKLRIRLVVGLVLVKPVRLRHVPRVVRQRRGGVLVVVVVRVVGLQLVVLHVVVVPVVVAVLDVVSGGTWSGVREAVHAEAQLELLLDVLQRDLLADLGEHQRPVVLRDAGPPQKKPAQDLGRKHDLLVPDALLELAEAGDVVEQRLLPVAIQLVEEVLEVTRQLGARVVLEARVEPLEDGAPALGLRNASDIQVLDVLPGTAGQRGHEVQADRVLCISAASTSGVELHLLAELAVVADLAVEDGRRGSSVRTSSFPVSLGSGGCRALARVAFPFSRGTHLEVAALSVEVSVEV